MENITLLLAIYGTILSTILAIREIGKERRNIFTILQYNEFGHRYSIICTNVGNRPITITNITIAIPNQDPVPQNVIKEINNPFPITIKDGEHFTLELPNDLSNYIYEAKGKTVINLFDSEGKSYIKYKKITYDEKYGTYRNTRY